MKQMRFPTKDIYCLRQEIFRHHCNFKLMRFICRKIFQTLLCKPSHLIALETCT